MDQEREELLAGLDDEERQARRRLLDQLVADGFTFEQLRAAVAEDRLVLLPVERLLGARFSAQDVERESGVPADLLLRIRRLSGLPEAGERDPVFGEEDFALAQSVRLFLDSGLGERAILEMTRVLGEAMARVAASTGAIFVESFLGTGDSEEDVAARFGELAEQLTPALEPVVLAAFKAHLRDSIRRGMISRTQRETGRIGPEQLVCVCFADVVGFTRLGSQIDVEELGQVAGTLGELATEVIRAPVRLIKTIGDAAMFASRDPAPMVAVALDLVEAAERAELPALRAGIALGPAALRGGDIYGHSVNLASRVTGVARPGSVLCTQEIHDAAKERFDWSFAGRYRLKGLSVPQALHRARARPAPTGHDDG